METLEKGIYEVASNLTIKTPENVTDVVLMFLLLTLNLFRTFF